jgi:signal transduction histidine kinase
VRLHVRTEHLIRARAELSQLVVHDLQNPLSAARSHLELALDPEIDDAERPAILRDARRALDRGIALVADLLDTSAAEEGRLRIDRQPAELREMCREVAEQYGPRHGAAYEIRITGSGPVHASVDRKLMYRVLENIVGNATRYVGQSGRVELSVTRRGDQAVVSVANDGPALAPEVRAWLFQKYAGDPPTGRTGGLGLYFCRLVVEAHGGTIRETAPEAGVRFEISLPAGAASPRRALDLSA